MTGEAFGGEARVWRATEDQQTHDWLPFHVSHLSSRSFMPRPPRGRPIPSSSTELTSSRTLPHKSSGSAREASGAFACTTADADASVVTQAIVNCVFVRVWAHFEVERCYFYFQSRAGTVISYKTQKNQIKSNIQCNLAKVFAPSFSSVCLQIKLFKKPEAGIWLLLFF